MFHPGRSGRNHLRSIARASGVGDARVDELLELVALTGAASRRAGGYSLGMRQRLGLAAALLGDPRVLVLDEPANGLDPQGIRWLRDFLRTPRGRGPRDPRLQPRARRGRPDRRRGRRHRARPLGRAGAARRADRPRAAAGCASPGRTPRGSRELLRADGAEVVGDGDRAIVVRGRTGEDIGRVIAGGGIVISELAPVGSSLEEIFFELTGAEGGPS